MVGRSGHLPSNRTRSAKRHSPDAHGLTLPVDEILQTLEPVAASVLKVWPDGPVPGVT